MNLLMKIKRISNKTTLLKIINSKITKSNKAKTVLLIKTIPHEMRIMPIVRLLKKAKVNLMKIITHRRKLITIKAMKANLKMKMAKIITAQKSR